MQRGIPSHGVSGYVDDDMNVLCPRCFNADRDNPSMAIFAGDEWEYQPHCEECGDEIDVTVIGEEEDEE